MGTMRKVSAPVFHLAAAAVRAFPEKASDTFVSWHRPAPAWPEPKENIFNSYKLGADEAKALVKQTHRVMCAAGRSKPPFKLI